MKEALLQISLFLLFVPLLVVSGCFITNCPPGGKRSGSDLKTRQCEQCGPEGGRCFGPHICCSSAGCSVGTSDTTACLKENLHTTLCQNPGDPCAGDDEVNPINGQCAAPGICCSSETCTMDESCQSRSKDGQSSPKSNNIGMDGQKQPVIFQSPINQWIPHRIGLGSLRHLGPMGFRKTLRLLPSDVQIPFPDNQLLLLDNGKMSAEEY